MAIEGKRHEERSWKKPTNFVSLMTTGDERVASGDKQSRGFKWKMCKLTCSKMWNISNIWERRSSLDDLSCRKSSSCFGNLLPKSSASKHFRHLHSRVLHYSWINQQNGNLTNFGFVCVTAWELSELMKGKQHHIRLNLRKFNFLVKATTLK